MWPRQCSIVYSPAGGTVCPPPKGSTAVLAPIGSTALYLPVGDVARLPGSPVCIDIQVAATAAAAAAALSSRSRSPASRAAACGLSPAKLPCCCSCRSAPMLPLLLLVRLICRLLVTAEPAAMATAPPLRMLACRCIRRNRVAWQRVQQQHSTACSRSTCGHGWKSSHEPNTYLHIESGTARQKCQRGSTTWCSLASIACD